MIVSSRLLGRVAATLLTCGLASAQIAHAQPPSIVPLPEAKPLPDEKLPAGGLRVTPVQTPNRMLVDVNANGFEILTLLKEVAKQANFKLIVSDDVHDLRVRVTMNFKGLVPESIFTAYTRQAGLACGRVGKDTYLLVRSIIAAAPEPANEPLPQSEPEKRNPDWKPFDFNGSQFYYVPAIKAESEIKRNSLLLQE